MLKALTLTWSLDLMEKLGRLMTFCRLLTVFAINMRDIRVMISQIDRLRKERNRKKMVERKRRKSFYRISQPIPKSPKRRRRFELQC